MSCLKLKIPLTLLVIVTASLKSFAQSNKPVTSAQVPTATGTVHSPSAYSGDIPTNFARLWTPKQEYANETDVISDATEVKDVNKATKYFDGMGRSLQTVFWQSSPAKKDMVIPQEYNEFGLQQYKYMPYTSSTNDGSLQLDPFTDQKNFLESVYTDEHFFYSTTNFEPTPLKRPVSSFPQGNSWSGSDVGKTIKYEFNTSADAVRIWTIPYEVFNEDNIPFTASEYADGELKKYITIDEQNKATVQYFDKDGKLILKKVQSTDLATPGDYTGYSSWMCTYYVYDDFGRLYFIITPKAVNIMLSQSTVTWALTSPDVATDLCFWFDYDARGRLISKKTPGAGWIYMVYDNHDRLVFTQDANMRLHKQWSARLYDDLNRVVLTGMINYPSGSGAGDWSDFNDLQAYVTGNTGSGTNTTITVGHAASVNAAADITINSFQTNGLDYKATHSIVWDIGFATDDQTNLVAEIVTASSTSYNEDLTINDDPRPSGSNFIALNIAYYDEYNFKNKTNSDFAYSTTYSSQLVPGNNLHQVDLPDATEQQKVFTRGMSTGSRRRVLNDPSDLTSGKWITSVNFYDEKGRLIQQQQENYAGGSDESTSLYDFSGKLLCNYDVHTNPQNTNASLQTIAITTNLLYDYSGRLLEVKKIINEDPLTERTIVRTEYDETGALSKKKIGGVPGSAANDPDNIPAYLSAYATNPSEILNYDRNVRGWLKGINKDYANGTGSSGSWFGMEISYDWGFTDNQINGNISGTKWRSKGDDEQRAYGYGYDLANRLQYADFSQEASGSYADDAVINFDMRIGTVSGGTWSDSYDENGNILKMKQWGLKLTSSDVVDDLAYTYNTNSNQLKNVVDANNEPATVLGDFRSSQTYMTALGGVKTSSAVDYLYDDNGNMKKDLNKDITDASIQAIQYNCLNLPWKIKVKDKGTITYIYDATGNKLEKITQDNTTPPAGENNRSKSTVYLNGFVYENNELKFFNHGHGRVRPTVVSGLQDAFNYDYFVKDNQNNVRVVLTDEIRQDTYPAATLESNAVGVESDYYSIQTGNIVANSAAVNFTGNSANVYPNNNGNPPYNTNPTSSTSSNSQKLYKLNGSTSNSMGLGITLKVMTGDVVDVFGKSYYHQSGTVNNSYSLTSVLNDLLNVFAASSTIVHSGKNVTGTQLQSSSTTTTGLTDWFQNNVPNPSSGPRAYINWILFDEQFRPVEGNCGFDAVSTSSDQLKDHHSTVSVSKCGYLYVFCSNESNVDVFFDNLQLIHTRGPLVETDEYYPFGGIQSGISYKALGTLDNNYKFSSNELQANEFAAGTGLELYDFNARMYDAQIGRFMAVDAMAGLMPHWSPYVHSLDNPVYYIDPSGLLPDHSGCDERDDEGDRRYAWDEKERNDPDAYNYNEKGYAGSFENDQATLKPQLDEVVVHGRLGETFDPWEIIRDFFDQEEGERGSGMSFPTGAAFDGNEGNRLFGNTRSYKALDNEHKIYNVPGVSSLSVESYTFRSDGEDGFIATADEGYSMPDSRPDGGSITLLKTVELGVSDEGIWGGLKIGENEVHLGIGLDWDEGVILRLGWSNTSDDGFGNGQDAKFTLNPLGLIPALVEYLEWGTVIL